MYISTESPLQTTRLSQILETHPKLANLGPEEKPSLSKIHSTHIHDLEAQEHILRYQVPVIIQRHNVGLVIMDSIAANFRPEFARTNNRGGAESFIRRSNQLQQLGALLHQLARKHNLAVVVANQVSDRIVNPPNTFQTLSQQMQTQQQPPQSTPHSLSQRPPHHTLFSPHQQTSAATAPPPPPILLSTDDPLALDHQQCFFTGWGDEDASPLATMNLKTPSLGLVWTNQLDARIALIKHPERGGESWERVLKVVFSAWGKEGGREFEIWEGGIKAVETENGQ